ncbi:MAG: hypothetical protein E6Q97_22280 [Desulfurellales bacterium]|nr:MAG: hypothetical protein E6Q97_22280 [Desulfurellales bacterium]
MSKTILIAVAFVLGFLAGKLLGSPRDEVRAAVADLQANVPQQDWANTRYLSLANVPAEERKNVLAVVGFVANSVGRSANLHNPDEAGDLVRVNLNRYGIASPAWEALASDREPYYHIRTKVIDPRTKKETIVHTDAGHVGLENAAKLRAMTGSAGAILRADWFVVRATTDHYYSLAAIPDTLAGWYASLGVDAKTISALAANRGANLLRSGVTQKERRISRWQGPLGGTWQTYDSEATDDPRHSPFRFPGFDGEYDAIEAIATKANGLHQFGLYNRAGKRQDSVPDRIAKDDSDPAGDGVLVPMLSCVRCHTASGYRAFANDQAELLKHLKGHDVDRLAAFYDTARLSKELARDQEDYDDAVAKATGGMAAKELPAALAKIVREYAYEQVTPEQAARDLGVANIGVFIVSNDPYLLTLVDGKSINRDAWHGSFNEAATLTGAAR